MYSPNDPPNPDAGYAQSRFYQPVGAIDPWGNKAIVACADHNLLAGARPGWSRPASSFAASTVTCTYRHCEQLSNVKSPNLSGPPCTMTR